MMMTLSTLNALAVAKQTASKSKVQHIAHCTLRITYMYVIYIQLPQKIQTSNIRYNNYNLTVSLSGTVDKCPHYLIIYTKL